VIEIVERRDVVQSEWDAIVESSPDGWVFALSGWIDLVTEVTRWGLRDSSFAIRRATRLVAVVPLHEVTTERRLSCSGWGNTMPTVIGSLANGERERVLQIAFAEVQRRAEQVAAVQVNFGISPLCGTALDSEYGVNPLLRFGVVDGSGHTLVLDLSASEEELRTQLSQDARQKIKRAQATGLSVHRVAWTDAVDRYYEVHRETYVRTGVTPHPWEYFSGIARHLDASHVTLWAARGGDGAIMAFHSDLCSVSGCQYHMGCSTAEGLETGANYLLFWHSILGAKAAGCSWYEIGEVFPGVTAGKEHGLTVFKSKFGGSTRRYFRGTLFAAPSNASTTTPLACEANFSSLLREWLRVSYRLFAAIVGDRNAARTRSVAVALHRKARGASRRATAAALAVKIAGIGRVPFMRPFWDDAEDRASVAATDRDTRVALDLALRSAAGLAEEAATVLTSSGRSALQLALSVVVAQNPGRRRVLLPSYSCRGLYDPIVNLGLVPDFVEVDRDLLPDSADMIARMGPDVLACIAVHLCGCRMDTAPVIEAAGRHEIVVVEDCCHSLGSGRVSDADFQIFSLGLGKTAMATAGGALASRRFASEIRTAAAFWQVEDSAAAAARYRHYRTGYFQTSGRPPAPLPPQFHTQFGSYLISDPDARLALVQLGKLSEIVGNRTRFGQRMRKLLSTRDHLVQTQTEKDHIHTKLTVTCVTKAGADRLIKSMTAQGVEIEPMYMPLHKRDFAAAYARRPLPFTEWLAGRVFNIPIRPNLTEQELRRIEYALDKALTLLT
jgi:dTDP-4-amino-4,6-dideoxygalactose transaminase